MKYIDLFAGIGGFRLGIELVEKAANSQTRPNQQKSEGRGRQWEHATCVYSNEWDKYAADTYEKNFRERPDTRSITDVPTGEIPDHDLLVGGFPCQAFSIAGKRQGFNDTRGTLFFDIARILKDKRPRHFILENVKGLLSHDSGKTFQTILRVLTGLGYEYQWQVLNSKNFGVPQNRERVFIVGHLRGEPRPKVFPIGKSNKQLYEKSVQKSNGGSPQPEWRVRDSERTRRKILGTSKIRRLTPVECERLQGFPDGWTEGVSDTQRYKQLGNAVTVNVVEEVVRRLYE